MPKNPVGVTFLDVLAVHKFEKSEFQIKSSFAWLNEPRIALETI